ncbi:hypothetical protein JKP88DRAFT_297365 [Tribonema minus]|uniref:Ankyrin repeat protein n=1 Tax=Tribonema minus TaxID=303371 RepID=A0A836CPI4_9STRA|nr:hypothetical protein JKP88DRAFT_297365 [Tribonema minus]
MAVVLEHAGAHCNMSLLHPLRLLDSCVRLITPRQQEQIALDLAERGDDGFALTWLSQQQLRVVDAPRSQYLLAAMCFKAAQGGHLATLQYLLHPKRGLALFGPLVYPDAVLVWLAGRPFDDEVANNFGDKDVLTYLVNAMRWQDREIASTLLDKAAGSGNIEMLRWLLAEGHAFTPSTMAHAAFHGQLPMLKWLRQQGCPHDIHNLFECAVIKSRAATVRLAQWVRSCGGGDWTPDGLARSLRLAMIVHVNPAVAAWLRSEGALWPGGLLEVTHDATVGMSSVRMMEWALESGCGWGAWTSAHCDKFKFAKYVSAPADAKPVLHALGCPCKCPRM